MLAVTGTRLEGPEEGPKTPSTPSFPAPVACDTTVPIYTNPSSQPILQGATKIPL